MWTILCALISLSFALYGVYAFTADYTCRIFNSSNKLKNICSKVTWIPSAIVVFAVLGIALYRSYT